MSPLLCWSLLAVSVATSVLSSPLSTNSSVEYHPYGTVNNSYIVMFKNGLPDTMRETHMNFVLAAHSADPLMDDVSGVQHVYDETVGGYAGLFTQSVIERIRRMPEVAYVEKDQIFRTQAVQSNAPYGLARISHRPKLTWATYNQYIYDPRGGQGVDVYVIDTGINIRHVDFEGRAAWGKTMVRGEADVDSNGHGTHCAGTIASRTYGVAKKAKVIAIKVFGASGGGTNSDIIGGISYAISAARARAATGGASYKGSVINMSLRGGRSQALDDASNTAFMSGVHVAVASGNDNQDACNFSPAAAALPITVGASAIGDERASFSNYGPCVDVHAPGVQVLSTYIGSNTATASLSGTSMASPHTAGLLAYFLSIYPSMNFDPTFTDADELISIHSQRIPSSPSSAAFPSALYARTHRALPHFISSCLPSPALLETVFPSDYVPVPPAPQRLSPMQLKNTLLSMTTNGLLTNLPARTVNKIIFNGATAYRP